MNVEELRLANAGAKVRCPKGDSYCLSQGLDCEGCRGRKWVYALPNAVRIPCPNSVVKNRCEWATSTGRDFAMTGNRPGWILPTCPSCQSRGWLPETDGSAWWNLIPTAFPKAHLKLSTCTDGDGSHHWRLVDQDTQLWECDQDALWLLLDWTQRALAAMGSK